MRWHLRISFVGLGLALILAGTLTSKAGTILLEPESVPTENSFQFASAQSGIAKSYASTITLAEYWQLVQNTHDMVDNLQGAPVDVTRSQLREVGDRWEAIDTILLPDDSTIPIEHSFFTSQLRASTPDLANLVASLTVLLDERDAWPQGKFTRDDVRSIDNILTRPEFQWNPTQLSPFEEWWAEAGRRIREFLVRLLGDRTINVDMPILEYILLGLGILAMALVMIYALGGIWGSLVTETELGLDGKSGDEGLTADLAFIKAQELSNAGDYRHAVRYLYISSLLLLEERGLLRFDRSKTNREYLRSVAHLPELSSNLREVVEVFDRVWYGYHSLDEITFNRYTDYVASLRRHK